MVIFLGDLNYRISLPEATTRLLAEREEWNALLDNDQVPKQGKLSSSFFFYELLVLWFIFCYELEWNFSWGWSSWMAKYSTIGMKERLNLLPLTNIIRILIYIMEVMKAKEAKKDVLLHGKYNLLNKLIEKSMIFKGNLIRSVMFSSALLGVIG